MIEVPASDGEMSCPSCAYDLRAGLDDSEHGGITCPECGRTSDRQRLVHLAAERDRHRQRARMDRELLVRVGVPGVVVAASIGITSLLQPDSLIAVLNVAGTVVLAYFAVLAWRSVPAYSVRQRLAGAPVQFALLVMMTLCAAFLAGIVGSMCLAVAYLASWLFDG